MIWVALVLASVAGGWLLGRGDASANWRAVSEAAPRELLTALLGVTSGLYARDRVRLSRTYASPTLAYLGKALLFSALAAVATFAMSPVSWPFGVLQSAVWAGAFGLAVWTGNLPTRL